MAGFFAEAEKNDRVEVSTEIIGIPLAERFMVDFSLHGSVKSMIGPPLNLSTPNAAIVMLEGDVNVVGNFYTVDFKEVVTKFLPIDYPPAHCPFEQWGQQAVMYDTAMLEREHPARLERLARETKHVKAAFADAPAPG